jgi:hypothetical protein
MMIRSAPRPVSTPPTEVASRQPCAVVSNSGIAARCGERRVAGNKGETAGAIGETLDDG